MSEHGDPTRPDRSSPWGELVAHYQQLGAETELGAETDDQTLRDKLIEDAPALTEKLRPVQVGELITKIIKNPIDQAEAFSFYADGYYTRAQQRGQTPEAEQLRGEALWMSGKATRLLCEALRNTARVANRADIRAEPF